MPRFTYSARDRSGRAQRGTLEAERADLLAQDLRGQGLLITSLEPAAEAEPSEGGQAVRRPGLSLWPIRGVHVEHSLYQLASMLRSGLGLLEALGLSADYAGQQGLGEVWRDVARQVQEGSSLHEAMARHRCFDDLTRQLVAVGEQTGELSRVLEQSALSMERRRELRNSLMTALTYPAIVFVAAVGVTLFMVFNLIPKLSRFLAAAGRQLPPTTQFLVDISKGAQAYWPLILLGLVLFSALGAVLLNWPPSRLLFDRLTLRIPLLGQVFRLAATARFSRTFGLLISSGVNVLEALRTAEQVHRSEVFRAVVRSARDQVLSGGSLGAALDVKHTYIPLLPRLITIGESAGTLEENLAEIDRFAEARLQRAIKQLSGLVEPAVVIVVGGIVGFVYVSFFQAVYG